MSLVPQSYIINDALDLDRTLTLGCDSPVVTFFPLCENKGPMYSIPTSSSGNIIVLSSLFIS